MGRLEIMMAFGPSLDASKILSRRLTVRGTINTTVALTHCAVAGLIDDELSIGYGSDVNASLCALLVGKKTST